MAASVKQMNLRSTIQLIGFPGPQHSCHMRFWHEDIRQLDDLEISKIGEETKILIQL